jgi:glycosyltransferase involved in cell wall biosynthesis
MHKDLSVIVPCFNAADTISAQLEALAGQKWSRCWEVIVADNGSTDNTLGVVQRYRKELPGFRVIDASKKRGAAHARNAAVSVAESDRVVFCDADDEAGSGWVEAIGEALFVHEFVASRFDTEKLNPEPLQKALGNPQKDGLQKLWYSPFLPFAGSSGMGVRREIHEAIGGFDESFCVLEDTDYCLRIFKRGVALYFVHEALMHVRYRDDLSNIYRQSRSWAEYNVRLYSEQRTSTAETLRLWKQFVRDWISLLRRLRGIQYNQGRAVLAWRLGRQIGRLAGSIKYRVPPV